MNKELRRTITGLLFLSPNITGFMVFTTFPIVFSLYMAFTNWDLTLHNMFKGSWPRFIFFENFVELLKSKEFPKYFGNTLFFMMGIPLHIGISLLLAILLNQDLKGKFKSIVPIILFGSLFVGSISILVLMGMKASALTILITSLFFVILAVGTKAGSALYRTLFYLPHFTAGVATFILWKKMYNPQTGPINLALSGPLSSMTTGINAITGSATTSPIFTGIAALLIVGMLGLLFISLRWLYNEWNDGSAGTFTAILSGLFLALPFYFLTQWFSVTSIAYGAAIAAALLIAGFLIPSFRGQAFKSTMGVGLGPTLIVALFFMVISFTLIGFAIVFYNLPSNAVAGLKPPEWLANYYWAKPAVMLMGLWGAIGSNNMILYQAGLTVIPQELYEAADVDGATPFQKFWHVTWPQLAPTTFFIFVMSIIGGLQGGFEMAKTMTQGGPAGATTTMSYFLYEQGFESGRLGYASAVAWALFAFVFLITIFNWKYGRNHEN